MIADKSADQGGAGESISSPHRQIQPVNIRFGNNQNNDNQMADSMTSILKDENAEHKNNDD